MLAHLARGSLEDLSRDHDCNVVLCSTAIIAARRALLGSRNGFELSPGFLKRTSA
jgi:hypothetical protein